MKTHLVSDFIYNLCLSSQHCWKLNIIPILKQNGFSKEFAHSNKTGDCLSPVLKPVFSDLVVNTSLPPPPPKSDVFQLCCSACEHSPKAPGSTKDQTYCSHINTITEWNTQQDNLIHASQHMMHFSATWLLDEC